MATKIDIAETKSLPALRRRAAVAEGLGSPSRKLFIVNVGASLRNVYGEGQQRTQIAERAKAMPLAQGTRHTCTQTLYDECNYSQE